MPEDELTLALKRRTQELNTLLDKFKTHEHSKNIIIDDIKEELLKEELQRKEQENKELKKSKENEETRTFYIINDLKQENNELKAKLKAYQKNKIDFNQTILNLNYMNAVEEYKNLKEQLVAENRNAEQMVLEYKEKYEKILKEHVALKSRFEKINVDKEEIINDYKSKILEIEKENGELNDQINFLKIENENLNVNNIDLKKDLRYLRNEIVDLKGNIRVFCRVRPLINNKSEKYNIELTSNTIAIDTSKFVFDEIFNPEASQDSVFKEVNFLIDSVFDGYNACIFAYGQTGSGKTFTMEGNENNVGIIPRSIKAIFNSIDNLKKDGWAVKVIVNFIEIYNETIRDLLSSEDKKLEIKHENNITYIKNCTYFQLESEEQAFILLETASKNRSTGYTQCNDRSSRSHSVFSCNIEMINDNLTERKSGTLNFIDLAGSERLNESGAVGIRLKETQNINKSLSSLGNVIMSILKNENHVPYRNSKLTYYLQGNLSGSAHVLMFVNVSPELKHINETLCSLRFAQKVSECKLGKSAKNAIKKL